MTSILTDWGKRCIEKLIKGVIAEARFVFCLSCIANEFDEEMARLKPELETLEQRVKEAKGRNKYIAANVVSWKEEVDKLIQEDTKAKQTCLFGFCPDCIWRYKRGKQLANDTEKIKGLIEKADKFGNIEVSRPPPGVEHKSSQDYISFESRLSKYKELLDALKDDNNYVTGLQGMAGTGKTTLAIKVGKELKESGQFTYVIDTTVSFTPDIKKIQDDIAGPLGLKWEDCNESDRPGKLWERLTKGEKILLILDDVWDEGPLLDFGAIGIPKRDNHEGCRVLVTTRSKQLSNQLNFDKSIELELLSKEDAWIMFTWYAKIRESSSNKVKKKGREIAKECKNLPVVIAVIASSLKGHHDRMEKWNATLTSLKNPITLDGVHPDLVGVFNRLKISYDNMNDEKAKGLFCLCSVFPEDEEISVEVLTRLSIGAGLFGEDYGSYNDARNLVVVAKNKLLDYCLLLEVKEKFVKMHDLLRELAQWIARKEIRRVNWTNKNQKSLTEEETNIKCLLCEGKYKDLFFCKFDGCKLETLIAREDIDEDCNVERDEDCNMKIPNSFFENIVKLRVLYLSCYGNRSLSLANSFQSLKNIRSMMVQKVDLGDVSVLGNLQSLETLDLVECTILELPNEIEKLENLKLLRLESCEIGKGNPFEAIKKCSSLEELYFIDSFNDSCLEITLPAKLRRYHIGIWKRHTIYLSHSKCVVLDEKVYGYFTKGTLEYFMKTAEAIELYRINSGWKNLMPEMVPIENGMNDLVELHLNYDSNLQCLIDTKQSDSQVPNVVFSKLAVLVLWEMEKLEELCNSPISLDCLNNLKEVTIHNCNHFRSLFKCSLNLSNLKKLKIAKCSTLISVFDLTSSQSLLQLETLQIYYCQQLENIFTYDGDNDNNKSCNSMFPNLKVLTILHCPQLQFILPCHSAGDLLSLESIWIERCNKLTQLIKHPWDDTIEEKVNGDNDNNSSCNSIMFPNLKEVTVKSCPQLEFVLPLQSAQDLLLLESIWIVYCDKLKYIFGQHQDVQLASLKVLELEDLPNFIDIFAESNHSMPSSIKRSSNSISKTQTQLEPMKSNVFSWSHICCHGYKSKGPTSTEISLVSDGQPKDFSISLEHGQCLLRPSHIMCDIKKIILVNLSKIKSVFVLSITSGMMLESLTIRNCDELKHIVVDIGDSSGSDNSVFLKLKKLEVKNCGKLEYIFGNIDASDDNQNHNLHLPALKCLKLCSLPSLTGMCTKNYRTTFPHLEELELNDCSQLDIVKDHLWERAQCLSRLSHILCNVKELMLVNLSKIKSVFVLSITSGMMLESLTIENCDELKHIIVDNGDSRGSDNSVFPKLKELKVKNCGKLEYIFGHIDDSNDHQNHNLHLPALKSLELYSLPSLTGMCTKNYRTTFPALAELELIDCSQLDIKSIGDFIVKESSGNVEHFVALERLKVYNSNVESICCLNEVCEREMNLGLQIIELYTLPMLTYLFKGLKKSFSLKNLTKMKIKGCEKLEILFSTSIIMCLPQLLHIIINECKELKHLIEDDMENRKTVCFPKLKTVFVEKCKMLKNVFPISICKELPELDILVIREADELEEIFVCEEGDQKVNIPNLKFVAFVNLPNLCQTQGIHFQAVQNRFIQSCQELSLTSAIIKDGSSFTLFHNYFLQDRDLYMDLYSIYDQLQKETRDCDTYNENPSSKTTEDTAAGIEVQVASENMLTSSQELVNQQHSLGEIDTTIKPSHGNDNLEDSTSEKPVVEPFSTISGTENEPPIQVIDHKQKGIMISVEEGTALTNTKTTSKHITTSQDQSTQEGCTSGTKNDQDIQLDSHETAQTNNDQESKGCDNGNENPSVETTKDFNVGSKVQAASSGHEITSSQLEGSTSEKTAAETMSTISESKNEPTTHLFSPKLKGIKTSVEKGSTSTNATKITSSTQLELADGDGKIDMTTSFSNAEVSRNDDTFKKVSSNIEESKPSPSTTSPIDTEIKVQAALGHELILSQELMDEESMDEQCMMNPQDSEGEIDTTIKPSQGDKEVGDGKICIPSFSIVNTKPTPTKDINKLIEEDPLLAFEKLLTGQVSISSIRILLQELKSLMDSSFDLEHLISNQESKSKLISLFNQLKQHQGLLLSHMKEFIEKVQTLNDYIIKYATFQQVLKKHNQLLDSKTDLVNKLWSAYSTQTRIDHEISTANARIDELSLQTDEHRKELEDIKNQREALKSVLNRCDVQKNKLKAECTEWAQQSDELISAFASSEVDVREAERARNLATEAFANLKSSFPAF